MDDWCKELQAKIGQQYWASSGPNKVAPLALICTNSPEESVGTSFINKDEACKAVLTVLRIWMASDIDAFEIVVMSAYKEQAKYLVLLRGRQTTSSNEVCLTVSNRNYQTIGKREILSSGCLSRVRMYTHHHDDV